MRTTYLVFVSGFLGSVCQSATLYTDQKAFTNSLSSLSIETFNDYPVDDAGFGAFSNGRVFQDAFALRSLSISGDISLLDVGHDATGLSGTFLVEEQAGSPSQRFVRPGGQGPAGSLADDDDFRADFPKPLKAFGLMILDNRTDEPGESVSFHAPDGTLLASGPLPGSTSGSGGPGFVGCICRPGEPGIGYVLVHEGSAFDDDIGFDDIMWHPHAEVLFWQITDRGNGGGACSSCCQIVHRQPIMAPSGREFAFASTWNLDTAAGNPNTNRNAEVFRYNLASGLFNQDTETDGGVSVPCDFTDSAILQQSSSRNAPANADGNVDLFVYPIASPSAITAVTVTDGPLPGHGDPGTEVPSVRWATRVLGFSSQYSADRWSAAQALGVPDVYPMAGDFDTAWASATVDGQREYLVLEYDDPEYVDTVAVYETYNPGAVNVIKLRNARDGVWETIWTGNAEPASIGARVFRVQFPLTSYPVDAVRIEVDSSAVVGYNEIDAVSLESGGCPSPWFSDTNWWMLANTHADLSSDSRYLAWASNRNIPSVGADIGANADANYEIWFQDLVDGVTRQVTQTTGGDDESPPRGANMWPRVATGGRHVIFASNRDLDGSGLSPGRHALFMWAPEKGISRLSSAEVMVDRAFPAFGSDEPGSRVVFASDADLTGQNPDGNVEIFAVSVPSFDVLQITDTHPGVTNSRPLLSGNGEKLAFLSNGDFSGVDRNVDGSEELWVYHFDPDRRYVLPFIQATHLSVTPPARLGRSHWMDWYSFDYRGTHLVMCTSADLSGSNPANFYEIFLVSFDWDPEPKTTITGIDADTGVPVLRWQGNRPNLVYRVESCGDLHAELWAPAAPTSHWWAAGTTWTNVGSGKSEEFFRIRAEEQEAIQPEP